MKRFLIFLCSVLVLSGCASGGRVSLEDGDKMMQTDQWTKMDSEQAAKKIMQDLITHGGFIDYQQELGHKPKLYIKKVENKTADPYFNIDELNNAFLTEISRSGKFKLLDEKNAKEVEEALKKTHDGRTKQSDVRSLVKKSGAEVLIFGEITSQPKREGRQVVNEYTVNIKLTDMESNEEIARMQYGVSKYKKQGWFSL